MGNRKYIETPELMWEYFTRYSKEVKDDPYKVKDWVGRDGDQVFREREKPLTMEGFETWLFMNDIITDIGDYLTNKDGRYSEYAAICRAIKTVIRKDQIEGGMAGMFNSSITQRLNGLVEKKDVNETGEKTIRVIYEQPDNKVKPTPQEPTDGSGQQEEV